MATKVIQQEIARKLARDGLAGINSVAKAKAVIQNLVDEFDNQNKRIENLEKQLGISNG